MNAHGTTRRRFMQMTALVMVGFSLSPRAGALDKAASGKNFKQVDAWLAIGPDGRVVAYSGKVELGTGVQTALAQIVADELDLPVESVEIVQGDTALTPDQGPTWGSLTIQVGGAQLRKAAACARRALVDAAARKLGVDAESVAFKKGVITGPGGAQLSLHALAGGHALDIPLDENVPVKSPKAYRVVGRSIARVEIPAKVTGEFTYMQDVRVPGMLHARMVRPAAIGADLVGIDDSKARDVPGYVTTVVKGNFVGVVARSEWGAIKAAQALQCRWSEWAGLPDMQHVYDVVRHTPVKDTLVALKLGDVDGALQSAAKRLEATYEYPVQTHGSIGPSCAVADVRADRAVIWSATQSTHWTKRQIAAMLGLPAERVRVIYVEGAGCYGRNGHEDAAADSAMLSRAVGHPVRVQWMRADEHGWDPKGPPYVAQLHGGLDAGGNVTAWDFVNWIPYRSGGFVDVPLLAQGLVARDVGLETADDMNAGTMESDGKPPYEFPNTRALVRKVASTPFRPSWLRSPGRMQNTFANECFIDELAAAAGVDPVEFRLRNLNDPRGAECIRKCAELAGWHSRPSPVRRSGNTNRDTGRGFAYVFYDNNRTYVAMACEVEVTPSTGQVRAMRFWVAHDCGLVVNPDGARAQIEGSVVQTLSRTLREEVKWDRSRVTSIDWVSYPILTFPEVPTIEIALIDRPDQPAWGVGEPSCAPVPAALSNAIFDATGVRVRTAPFTPERVKAAFAAGLH